MSTRRARWGDRFSPPSLRAKRRNPESFRGDSLDCFVARAPRNDETKNAGAVSRSGVMFIRR
ncbi:hypothetical protein GWG65_00550 [Bradyrhizobium sp. CSA207]|nr:hypothetical protein [Bradyrhizobium sp. CSA207]